MYNSRLFDFYAQNTGAFFSVYEKKFERATFYIAKKSEKIDW